MQLPALCSKELLQELLVLLGRPLGSIRSLLKLLDNKNYEMDDEALCATWVVPELPATLATQAAVKAWMLQQVTSILLAVIHQWVPSLLLMSVMYVSVLSCAFCAPSLALLADDGILECVSSVGHV
jgi:hypothetical protein